MVIRTGSRRLRVLGTVGVTALLLGGGLGIAAASDGDTVGAVSCPTLDVAALGAVPDSAEAEVERNLAQLNTQVTEADDRLRSSVGQGGPNFVRNAILGPLASKRTATINRIATAIGRQGVRPRLDVAALSACSVADAPGVAQPVEVTPDIGAGAGAGSGADQGAGGGTAPGGGAQAGGGAQGGAAPGTIACPGLDIATLGVIPASAAAEVRRNLDLLDTQVAEANNRLRSSVGQGGPNFVRNAILGPLASKRTATINRIATAIGRQGVRPNLDAVGLARCAVSAR